MIPKALLIECILRSAFASLRDVIFYVSAGNNSWSLLLLKLKIRCTCLLIQTLPVNQPGKPIPMS